jgi:hypothetical protein
MRTGAAAPLLGQVAGCRAAVGSPLASLAAQHCQLSATLAAAQQAAQAVAAQAELQQRLSEFDAQLRRGVPLKCPRVPCCPSGGTSRDERVAASTGDYGGAALGALELLHACEAGVGGSSEGQQLRDAAEQRANALGEVPAVPSLPACRCVCAVQHVRDACMQQA